ncbi:MAG TPA: LLM class F420-dependent oxidoreductase [Acidimicrobiales bacterium]|nr:LLM class F420-dependent oxidoreductase [Acidimicrobiales bacterium]
MHIGITSTNIAFYAEREHAAALARTAEAAGVESLWTFEHVVVPGGYESTYPYSRDGRMPGDGRAAITDPLTWLCFCGAVTERIKLGTGILILPEHNPVLLAKEAATVDRLSGGRLLLGIGVGWLKEEFDALGVPWARRGARTDGYVEVLRRLWTEEEVTLDTEWATLTRARCSPQPVQAGGVPIVVGGHSEAAARRAGRIGDGFYPAAPPDRVAALLQVMRRAAEDAGRDPSAIEVTAGDPTADPDSVRRYEDLGVSRVVVGVPTYDPSQVEAAFGKLHEELLSRL